MNKIKIVQVDDSEEELIVGKKLISKFEDVQLLRQFTSAMEAAKFILNNDVDLALLDVEMPGKNGFWLADKIKNTKTFVIFLTSHSEYTLRAFETCAIHYLLKPASLKVIEEAIERFKKVIHKNDRDQYQSEKIDEFLKNYLSVGNYPKRIFIYNIHKTIIINLEELEYMTSEGAYTIFKQSNGEINKSSLIIKTYEQSLIKHPDFLRIHRGYIINKKFVKSINQNRNQLKVEMKDGTVIPVSPRLKNKIYDVF